MRALAAAIAELTGAKLGFITDGPNAAGASLAGVLPHRDIGGRVPREDGLDDVLRCLRRARCRLLVNVEPDADIHAARCG